MPNQKSLNTMILYLLLMWHYKDLHGVSGAQRTIQCRLNVGPSYEALGKPISQLRVSIYLCLLYIQEFRHMVEQRNDEQLTRTMRWRSGGFISVYVGGSSVRAQPDMLGNECLVLITISVCHLRIAQVYLRKYLTVAQCLVIAGPTPQAVGQH